MSLNYSLDKKVFVLFSAISDPCDSTVQNSLLELHSTVDTIVITSKKHEVAWKELVSRVEVARFSSTKQINRFIKALLNRSTIIRKIFNHVMSTVFSNYRWAFMPPHNARHFESLKVIQKLPDEAWVFLVDSRDLIFQVDPRTIVEGLSKFGELHFFDERERNFKSDLKQINVASPANWNWAKMLLNYDTKKLDHLAHNWIINSGCIIGIKDAIIEFLENSCECLSKSLYSTTDLLDQASTNYVAYQQELGCRYRVHANGEVVLNMCGKIGGEVEIFETKLYLRNELIPIVHQFDRFGTWNLENGFSLSKRDYNFKGPAA